ncbi:Kinase-like protein [Venustampulla echinocandica]|uniref:Kinase-like protein n=1 Tax=Venustampulla echinocandica TaxID=2656787 RepID=A0A370TJ15_9HELO|nr:Kinase-like protein [Venustampulla echinocandica]RDL35338.1 Kinase-like protein [Venustampulla echinocandica]
MDYMEGERLDKVCNGLPEEEKLDLVDLKGEYIGSLDRGTAIYGRRFNLEGGPFDMEVEFIHFLLSDTLRVAPQILRDIASCSLRTDHKAVFTLGDFALRNINAKDGQVMGLLGWENSGWYPEYWEYVRTLNGSDHRLSWYNYAGQIFPNCYEAEYINDRFLGSLLRH